MAFLPPQDQNNEAPTGITTNNPQGGSTPPPQSGGSSGAGSTAGGPKPGGTSTGGTPTQFGSSASKLGDYLTANAPQITNQANAVAGTLNNQYGQVSGDLSNAVDQFGQSVAAGYVAPNQDIVNQAAANPAGFVSQDPNNVSAFQAQYNDAYNGPQNFESTTPYGQIQSEVSNAVQNAGTLNTQAGLQNYFSGTGGNQTQASNTLDALLLQGNPGAQQTISNAANQFQNLNPTLANDTTQADAGVTAAQQAAANASQYAQNTINPVGTNLSSTLNNQVTTGQNAENAYNQLINQNNQYIGQAQPIASDINAYETAQNQPISGDLAQYLGGNTPLYSNMATVNNTATSQQAQEAAALQQLIGTGYQNPISNPSQAGTFNVPTGVTALTAPDLAGLERNDLTNLTTAAFNQAYGNSPVARDPANQNPFNESGLIAGEPGAGPAAYEALLAQLAGFNNGVVGKIPSLPGQNYYQINQGA